MSSKKNLNPNKQLSVNRLLTVLISYNIQTRNEETKG